MLVQKLPKLFQSDPVMLKLAQLIEGKKTLFSSIVYADKGKKYIINKHSETPYFDKDWQCYCFLRCYVKTLLTTGSVIRAQKDLFKSYFTCGDKLIEQMFENFKTNERKNVYVMTKSMKRQQLYQEFNHEIYNLLNLDFTVKETKDKHNLNEIIQNLTEKSFGPVLVQCGPVVMNEYFETVKKGLNENKIEAAYLAYFEGNLPGSSIGNELQFAEDLFQPLWESEKYPVHHRGQLIGSFYFKAFKGKPSI